MGNGRETRAKHPPEARQVANLLISAAPTTVSAHLCRPSLTEFSRGYAQPETSKFEQIANHRISSLTGSGVVWKIFQSAHAKIDFANIEICGDIPNAARQLIKNNKSDAEISAAASKMIEHAQKVHDELFEYAEFFKQLHKLGLLLESERLSLKSVTKFCEKSEVKEIIDALRKEYPSDIAE